MGGKKLGGRYTTYHLATGGGYGGTVMICPHRGDKKGYIKVIIRNNAENIPVEDGQIYMLCQRCSENVEYDEEGMIGYEVLEYSDAIPYTSSSGMFGGTEYL